MFGCTLGYDKHRTQRQSQNYAAGEEHMTRTEFDLSKFLTDPDNGKRGMPSYFRVTVTGFDGSEAYTRAFFMDEFDKLAE